MAIENLHQRLGAVLQQMEAVGDLDRVRSAAAHAVGVGAGPVAGDDLGTGMALQPAG